MDQSNSTYSVEDLERDLEKIWRALEARSVFVIDDAGQIISTYPAGSQLDAAVLGALAAANLAATQQIIHVIDGEDRDSPRFLFIEAASGGILLCGARNGLSLAVVLGQESPLGLARLMAQEMTARLEDLQRERTQYGAEEDPDLAYDILDQLDELLG